MADEIEQEFLEKENIKEKRAEEVKADPPKAKKIKTADNPLFQANIPVRPLQTQGIIGRGPFVKHIGVATLRIMDAKAWAQAGVNSTKYVEWNSFNNKMVPKSVFTEDELKYLLERDDRFILVD